MWRILWTVPLYTERNSETATNNTGSHSGGEVPGQAPQDGLDDYFVVLGRFLSQTNWGKFVGLVCSSRYPALSVSQDTLRRKRR